MKFPEELNSTNYGFGGPSIKFGAKLATAKNKGKQAFWDDKSLDAIKNRISVLVAEVSKIKLPEESSSTSKPMYGVYTEPVFSTKEQVVTGQNVSLEMNF